MKRLLGLLAGLAFSGVLPHGAAFAADPTNIKVGVLLPLTGTFAAVALILAALGIYGVMSFAVAQRTHEIGLRMALGAGPSRVLGLVVKEGMILTLAGLIFGMLGAFLVGRAMKSQLYGIGTIDPVAFGGVATVLVVSALLACYIPARRAMRVDPMVALRYE